jgi:CheY-like chemotaxis protein
MTRPPLPDSPQRAAHALPLPEPLRGLPETPAACAAGTAPAAPGHLLVIVHGGVLRRLPAEVFTEEGYRVWTTGDGARGLLLATQQAPRLVLLDRRLAGLAGRTFADWYRAQPGPQAPVVLVSAGSLAELLEAVGALGAVGYVRLPCELEELLALTARTVRPAAPPAALPAPLPKERRVAAAARGGAAGAPPRRRRLRLLAHDLWALRPAIARIREELRGLQEREHAGRLPREERARLRCLRREGEAQQHRMRVYQQEYERLRRAGTGDR